MALTKKNLETITIIATIVFFICMGLFMKTYYPSKTVMETTEQKAKRMRNRKIFGALATVSIVGAGVSLMQASKAPQYYYF
jgi:hypothetical protein